MLISFSILISYCITFYRFANEQGEHLHYAHQRFFLNRTSHGGGKSTVATNLQLLQSDFRKLVVYARDNEAYSEWREEAEVNHQQKCSNKVIAVLNF